MPRLYINPTLEKNIRDYCELNDIDDVNAFANRCALQGFNIVKFGTSPMDNINREINGIKDIKKNGSTKKKEPIGEDSGKQEEPKANGGKEEHEEESKPTKKEQVVIRKIQVIKKQ